MRYALLLLSIWISYGIAEDQSNKISEIIMKIMAKLETFLFNGKPELSKSIEINENYKIHISAQLQFPFVVSSEQSICRPFLDHFFKNHICVFATCIHLIDCTVGKFKVQ
ncbi:hypothetical protein CHS0354_009452 [Potamilus streckersoni]|uniref:Uncharacterized protein n=1 Tax=Potamilus streckersoni TaxID=2493646 RepID=A0AAE0TIX5_9BIVA|nr:hypothetical protein CHS0354_009452 [Potamilus streckersoni]